MKNHRAFPECLERRFASVGTLSVRFVGRFEGARARDERASSATVHQLTMVSMRRIDTIRGKILGDASARVRPWHLPSRSLTFESRSRVPGSRFVRKDLVWEGLMRRARPTTRISRRANTTKARSAATTLLMAKKDTDVWQTRVDLAATYRLCDRMGYNEGICNHLTAMVPGSEDQFLVIPYGMAWSEVTASSLLLVDGKGNVLEGEGTVEDTAFYIHSRIHLYDPKNRGCVLHTHMPWSTALCCLKDMKLEMCHQNCLRFYNSIAYDTEFNGLVLNQNEADRLNSVMENKHVLFHANHGVIVVGPNVAEAFDDLYYLERAAQVTVLAMSTGRPLNIISDEVAHKFQEDLKNGKNEWATLHFESRKRELLAGDDADFCT